MDDLTLGELFRRQERFERHLDRQLADIKQSIDNQVNKETYAVELGAIQARVKALEDARIRWPAILATALISSTLAVIIPLLFQIK